MKSSTVSPDQLTELPLYSASGVSLVRSNSFCTLTNHSIIRVSVVVSLTLNIFYRGHGGFKPSSFKSATNLDHARIITLSFWVKVFNYKRIIRFFLVILGHITHCATISSLLSYVTSKSAKKIAKATSVQGHVVFAMSKRSNSISLVGLPSMESTNCWNAMRLYWL